ncbi:MAG: VWA domain-containing protein [Acidobacteria bacterium]|nr:VWA domain-containing protein [Acidobacteriota bacterium]
MKKTGVHRGGRSAVLALLALIFAPVSLAPGQDAGGATDLSVRISAPTDGAYVSGRTLLQGEIDLPAGDSVLRADFLVNGTVVASLRQSPWQVTHDFGASIEVRFIQLRVVTRLGHEADAEVTTRRLVIHEATGIDLVNVFATVQDERGRFVMDLQRDDFLLLEDGRPQKVSYFSRDRLPLAVQILIDSSLSMEGRNLEEARRAAAGFLHALEPGDLAGIIGFSDQVRVYQDLSLDRKAAAAAIQQVRAGGGTALYDAVAEASRRLAGVDDERRRAIILLSDGRDEAASGLTPGSLLTFEESLAEVVQANVILYAIGLGRKLDQKMDFYHRHSLADVLNTLATESGGRSFLTPKAERLKKSYGEVEAELRHHYTLSYTSTNRRKDGLWRGIDLRVRRKGFTAHARRGYYAPWEGPPG